MAELTQEQLRAAIRAELLGLFPADYLAFLQGGVPFASQTGTALTVTTTSAIALGVNPRRWVATFVNYGATDIFIAKGPLATANSGIAILANGGVFTCGRGVKDDPYTGAVSVIVAGGTSTLLITEA